MAQDELAKRGGTWIQRGGDGGDPPGNSYIHVYIQISHQKSLLTFDSMIFPAFRFVGYVFSFPGFFFWGGGY